MVWDLLIEVADVEGDATVALACAYPLVGTLGLTSKELEAGREHWVRGGQEHVLSVYAS